MARLAIMIAAVFPVIAIFLSPQYVIGNWIGKRVFAFSSQSAQKQKIWMNDNLIRIKYVENKVPKFLWFSTGHQTIANKW